MFKRILMVAVLGVAGSLTAVKSSEAGVFYRRPIAPVRRVAARTVLPPYPVARTVLPPYPVARGVIGAPILGPVVGPAYGVGYAPAYYGYGSPYVYGSGLSVVVGY